jgi:ubiquinone/menaquinone biosynthesis C-methylase UbiE
VQQTAGQKQEYVLGHSPTELQRLTIQAKLLEPFTRAVFEQAGVGPGMSVLDIGSGAGDVAFLAASIVGREGKVTGVDRARQAVETARQRASGLGLSNVTFVEGDPAEISFDEPFDAVVGRFVLMYYPDPAKAVRSFVRHLRPGGIVVFQEADNTGARSFPRAALYERLMDLTGRMHELSGSEIRMGWKLYPAFVTAGLPPPAMQAHVGIIGARDPHLDQLFAFLVQGLRSVLPAIIKYGLATAEELDVDTYAKRMIEEFKAGDGVLMSPPFVGAWTRKTAHPGSEEK